MRISVLPLGLSCALLALACSTADNSSKATAGESLTDTSSTGGSTGSTTHHGDTLDLTTGATGTTDHGTTHDTTGDDTTGTTGHDHTTGTTGHDHTTGTTGHDHTTGTTGHDHTTGTTGEPGACADLDEKTCLANKACMPLIGQPIDLKMMCMQPHAFIACADAGICGGAQTVACSIDDQSAWLFPSTCIPDNFAPCEVKPFDQPCK